MNVLVTGANGFVGRHLCRRLLEAGHHVRGSVRSQTAAAALPQGIQPFLIDSVQAFRGWPSAVRGMDAVVHLIARTHVMKEREPNVLASYRGVNVVGTQRLLEACRGEGIRRFVYVSSIKAVGEGTDHAYRETDDCRPEDAYGKSKLEAERVVWQMAGALAAAPVVVRPPLVYGPGAGGNFERLLRAIERGLPLPVGGIRNLRSMIHVQNLASAIELCLISTTAAGETFHVADDCPLATPELVRLIADGRRRRARIVPVPVAFLHCVGAVANKRKVISRLTRSLTVNTDKIQGRLGWRPPIPANEGVRLAAASFQLGSHDTDIWLRPAA